MMSNGYCLRKLAATVLIALLPHSALAGLPPTSVQGQSDTSATTKFNFQVPYNQYTNLGGIKALLETGNHNILLNPNFENSTATTSWTATTASGSSESTNVADGLKSYHLAFSSQTGNMAQSVTPTIQMTGVNMVASCKVKTSMTTIQLCALNAGTEISCNNVASNNTWAPVSVNFIGPSSGSIGVDVKTSSSGTGDVYIDDCYVGPAYGFDLYQTTQAQLWGTVKVGACASAFATSSTSFASSGTVASCTYIATGNAAAPATNLMAIKFASMPPGEYIISYEGSLQQTTAAKAAYYQFTDGSNTAREISTVLGGANGLSPGITQSFTYTTTQTNVQWELFGKTDSGGTANWYGQTAQPGVIKVWRYPTTTDVAFNAGQSPASWAGYHDNTCSWARTNTSYGDPTADVSCALVERLNRNFGTVITSGSVLPAITFNPPKAGRYYVCATPKIAGATTGAFVDARLWDGTTVIAEAEMQAEVGTDILTMPICGIYNAATSASVTLSLQTKASSGAVTIATNSTNTSALEWSIFQLDYGMNAPLLVGSVISPSTGVEKTIRANATCSSSSTINHQDGGFTSIGNVSSGQCSFVIPNEFSNTTYDCSVLLNGTAVTSIVGVNINNKKSTGFDVYFASISSGSSTIAAATNVTFDIVCRGPN